MLSAAGMTGDTGESAIAAGGVAGEPSEVGAPGSVAGEAGAPDHSSGGAGDSETGNDDDGCSCRVVGARRDQPISLGFGLLLLGALRRKVSRRRAGNAA
jgi:MYXO-CTERM domain-containing protein